MRRCSMASRCRTLTLPCCGCRSIVSTGGNTKDRIGPGWRNALRTKWATAVARRKRRDMAGRSFPAGPGADGREARSSIGRTWLTGVFWMYNSGSETTLGSSGTSGITKGTCGLCGIEMLFKRTGAKSVDGEAMLGNHPEALESRVPEVRQARTGASEAEAHLRPLPVIDPGVKRRAPVLLRLPLDGRGNQTQRISTVYHTDTMMISSHQEAIPPVLRDDRMRRACLHMKDNDT